MSEVMERLPSISKASALAFVEGIDLGFPTGDAVSGAGRGTVRAMAPYSRFLRPEATAKPGAAAAAAAPAVRTVAGSDADSLGTKTGIDQAYIVGGQVISFNRTVTEERRAAAINSCLLAQLRAARLHGEPTTRAGAEAWHATYINTLTNIGWVLQSGVRLKKMDNALGAEVDKVLLEVVGTLLGTVAGTALVKSVLTSLAKVSKDDPFITLYSSRVVEEDVVSFGAGLGQQESSGFLLAIAECAIAARAEQQQVLFFKWKSQSVSVQGRRYDLSLADGVYGAARTLIEAKILPYVRSFVAEMEI